MKRKRKLSSIFSERVIHFSRDTQSVFLHLYSVTLGVINLNSYRI